MNKKICKLCLLEKDVEHFSKLKNRKTKDGKNVIVSKCKKCKTTEIKVIHKLKKIYKKPIHKHCYCCGKYCENLVLDHDHKTNKFRGWLCKSCNVGIGYLGDNIEGLLNAIQYIKQSSIKQEIV